MTESVPTTWNQDRDGAFFAITAKLLDELAVAESWESMTQRVVARGTPHDPELVPVRVVAPHRKAR
jgi:hypothetical protein